MVSIDDVKAGAFFEAEPSRDSVEIRRILEVTKLWDKGNVKYQVVDFKRRSDFRWASDPNDHRILPLNTPEVPLSRFLKEAAKLIPTNTDPAIFEEGVAYRAVTSDEFFIVWEVTDFGVYTGGTDHEPLDFKAFWEICQKVIVKDDFYLED